MNPWRLQGLTEPTMTQETQQHPAVDPVKMKELDFEFKTIWLKITHLSQEITKTTSFGDTLEDADAWCDAIVKRLTARTKKLLSSPEHKLWHQINMPTTTIAILRLLHKIQIHSAEPTTSTQSTNAKTKPKAGSKANEQTYSRATEAEAIANADIKVATTPNPASQLKSDVDAGATKKKANT